MRILFPSFNSWWTCFYFLTAIIEDVLTTNVGHYWSPDARYVIMAKFDDTKVPLQKWKVYGEVSDVYGSITEIAYPKVTSARVDFLSVLETGDPKSSM